jgi:hypothetical protein
MWLRREGCQDETQLSGFQRNNRIFNDELEEAASGNERPQNSQTAFPRGRR